MTPTPREQLSDRTREPSDPRTSDPLRPPSLPGKGWGRVERRKTLGDRFDHQPPARHSNILKNVGTSRAALRTCASAALLITFLLLTAGCVIERGYLLEGFGWAGEGYPPPTAVEPWPDEFGDDRRHSDHTQRNGYVYENEGAVELEHAQQPSLSSRYNTARHRNRAATASRETTNESNRIVHQPIEVTPTRIATRGNVYAPPAGRRAYDPRDEFAGNDRYGWTANNEAQPSTTYAYRGDVIDRSRRSTTTPSTTTSRVDSTANTNERSGTRSGQATRGTGAGGSTTTNDNNASQPNRPTPRAQPPNPPVTRDDRPFTLRDIDFVPVASGTFTTGSPADEIGRDAQLETQRRVTVRGFAIARTEITQRQYHAIMSPGRKNSDAEANLPMTEVSYDDAVQFCRRLSQLTGRAVRLPTESEWEYACRAGSADMFAVWRGDLSNAVERYANNLRRPLLREAAASFNFDSADGRSAVKPVKQYPANAWGLHDMHGNVWEWCAPDDAGDLAAAPSRNHRPIRGGGWRSSALDCRAAKRAFETRDTRKDSIGFRVVIDTANSLTLSQNK